MKNKGFALLIVVALALTLSACGAELQSPIRFQTVDEQLAQKCSAKPTPLTVTIDGNGYICPNSPAATPTAMPKATEASATNAPAPTAVAVCDPSTVAYPKTDRELNPNNSGEVLVGPGIVEWWDPTATGDLEGVWAINADESLHLRAGLRGHWFPINSETDLSCVFPLHVQQYSSKPQHAGKTYDQLVIKPPLAK